MPYVAVLGGTETFGPFVQTPYPELMQDWLDQPVINLGVQHASVSLFASEPWVLDCATNAEVTVMQVLGAANMSNRLYSVHSRRNDRFLAVSPALKEIFPDVDFTDFNFIRHMLQSLAGRSQSGFEMMVQELQWAWVQRMRRVISCIDSDIILLWMSDRAPNTPSGWPHGPEPLFVTKPMLESLAGDVAAIVEVVSETEGNRLDGKQFAKHEKDAALSAPGPLHHAQAAEQLCDAIWSIQVPEQAKHGIRDHRTFPQSRTAF